MKVLVFDLKGDLGHFKKYYTTSSPLTHSFPPKTVIFGICAAILGLDKKTYLKELSFSETRVAVQLLSPVKKIRIGIKWIKTSSLSSMHKVAPKPIVQEFIKDAYFRIFVTSSQTHLFSELAKKVQSQQSYYSISLGLSECLATYHYIGIWDAKAISSEEKYLPIDSLLPVSTLSRNSSEPILIEVGKQYQKERCCTAFSTERDPIQYEDFIYDHLGAPIQAKVTTATYIDALKKYVIFV